MPVDSGRFLAAALIVACVAALDAAATTPTQAPASKPATPGLTIAGDVSKPLTLSLADLKALPRTTVTADEQGRPTKYEGVLVSELLTRAGAPMGRGLGGNGLMSYVRAMASDGYEVLFSLGELDNGLTSNDIIVADTADGKPLFDFQGPLRIVAPHDTRGARSLRMLQRLDIVRLHDGSVATLEDAIDHYAAAGRTLRDGPYAGGGSANPNKTGLLRGFTITPEQKADLLVFLTSLTDEPLLHDPRFSNSWPQKTTETETKTKTETKVDALVFAAASLQNALDALVQPLQRATGVRMTLSYAASSALARQIESGAPADLLISADLDWMDYLAERKLIQPATRVNLLGNRLVLVAPRSTPVALEIGPGFNLAGALGRDRLALANPDVVPAGKYAKAALTSLGVWNAVSGRIAPAENVRGALLLVSRGEAPLGIVYRTDARADPGVVIVDTFPESTHPPIVYPAALTSTASASAQKVLDFLKSDQARKVFDAEGFTAPSSFRGASAFAKAMADHRSLWRRWSPPRTPQRALSRGPHGPHSRLRQGYGGPPKLHAKVAVRAARSHGSLAQ